MRTPALVVTGESGELLLIWFEVFSQFLGPSTFPCGRY